MQATGEDFFAAGDWNSTVLERPWPYLLASHAVGWADENWRHELQGTVHVRCRRTGSSRRTDRVIDFGIHSKDVQ
eukprot:8392432-Alexandrium_andersonii.AAC.1